MVEADKKSESEVKVVIANNAKWTLKEIDALKKRVRDLEEHLMSLDHSNEQGNNPDDGGWFD